VSAPQKQTPGGTRAQADNQKSTEIIAAPADNGKLTELSAWASEINIAHQHATQYAEKAIDYARQAGKLLLDVKAKLPHGEFIAWVEKNCTVSLRQAQRYLAAAQGKPLAIRTSKNDTVSYLGDDKAADKFKPLSAQRERDLVDAFRKHAHADSWLHFVYELGLTADKGVHLRSGDDDVLVEPATEAGWFHVYKPITADGDVEFFNRPTNLAGVGAALDHFEAVREDHVRALRRGNGWLWQELIEPYQGARSWQDLAPATPSNLEVRHG